MFFNDLRLAAQQVFFLLLRKMQFKEDDAVLCVRPGISSQKEVSKRLAGCHGEFQESFLPQFLTSGTWPLYEFYKCSGLFFLSKI